MVALLRLLVAVVLDAPPSRRLKGPVRGPKFRPSGLWSTGGAFALWRRFWTLHKLLFRRLSRSSHNGHFDDPVSGRLLVRPCLAFRGHAITRDPFLFILPQLDLHLRIACVDESEADSFRRKTTTTTTITITVITSTTTITITTIIITTTMLVPCYYYH